MNAVNENRRISIRQLLLIFLLTAIPLACFVNSFEIATGSVDGATGPLVNLSGKALFWLATGLIFATMTIAILFYRRFRLAAILYTMVVVALSLTFGSRIYFANTSESVEIRTRMAESNDRAMSLAVVAVRKFVMKNEGQWPAELSDLKPFLTGSEFIDVTKSVDIEFLAVPAALAEQEWHEFSGIRPHEPTYNLYRIDLIELIELLGKYQ